MDLYFIIFIIAILSYYYLFNEINKNNYLIIIIYFVFLVIGYYYIGLKIYLYNTIIIIYNVLKNNKERFKEGRSEEKRIEEKDIEEKIVQKANEMGPVIQKAAEKHMDDRTKNCSKEQDKIINNYDKCIPDV
jgi:amino acid permease